MTPATMPLSTSAISDTSIQYILTAGGYVDMCMDGSWKGCFLFVDVTKGRIDIRQKRQSGLLGTITLRRFQLLERDSNAFDIATPNRTYRMKTRTTQSKESWMKTLLYLCEHQSEIDDFVKHVCVQTKSNGENILHWIDDHETDHCASCKKEVRFMCIMHPSPFVYPKELTFLVSDSIPSTTEQLMYLLYILYRHINGSVS